MMRGTTNGTYKRPVHRTTDIPDGSLRVIYTQDAGGNIVT